MQPIIIEKSVWIKAPREQVWEAITTDSEIRRWWGQDYWEIPCLELGGVIKFGPYGDEKNLILASITVLEPPHRFSIHWEPNEYSGTTSYTHFVLEPENGGTRMMVSETGFETLPDDTRQQRYEGTAKGYEAVLKSLKSFVETGSST